MDSKDVVNVAEEHTAALLSASKFFVSLLLGVPNGLRSLKITDLCWLSPGNMKASGDNCCSNEKSHPFIPVERR